MISAGGDYSVSPGPLPSGPDASGESVSACPDCQTLVDAFIAGITVGGATYTHNNDDGC